MIWKLVLNTDQTELMIFVFFFSHAKVLPQDIPNFMTSNGKAIEQVLNYKYLSFILDQELLIKAREKKNGSLHFWWSLGSFSKTEKDLTVGMCFIWVPHPNVFSLWTQLSIRHGGMSLAADVSPIIVNYIGTLTYLHCLHASMHIGWLQSIRLFYISYTTWSFPFCPKGQTIGQCLCF